jgi:hypothetical protein
VSERAAWLLAAHLDVAVSLEIAHLARLHPDDRADVMFAWSATAVDLIVNSDASLLFPIRASAATGRHVAEPGTAATFAALAKGLAAGACVPGGITAFGRHWCVDHQLCEAAVVEASERAAQEPAA